MSILIQAKNELLPEPERKNHEQFMPTQRNPRHAGLRRTPSRRARLPAVLLRGAGERVLEEREEPQRERGSPLHRRPSGGQTAVRSFSSRGWGVPGSTNVIVPADLYREHRELVNYSPFVLVRGKFERNPLVLNVGRAKLGRSRRPPLPTRVTISIEARAAEPAASSNSSLGRRDGPATTPSRAGTARMGAR